jgi:RNA recognition motif-containing protein
MLIYIGNIPDPCSESEIKDIFSAYGAVRSVRIIATGRGGRAKSYGFVDMPYDQEARLAIQELHETDLAGHSLQVMVARPRLKSSERSGTLKPNQKGGGYTRQF